MWGKIGAILERHILRFSRGIFSCCFPANYFGFWGPKYIYGGTVSMEFHKLPHLVRHTIISLSIDMSRL